MSIKEIIYYISALLAKDLNAKFTNRIWSAWFHVDNINWDKDTQNCTVKDYMLQIRTTTRYNIELIQEISNYICTKYTLGTPVINTDEDGFYVIIFKRLAEERLLEINTLFKMS